MSSPPKLSLSTSPPYPANSILPSKKRSSQALSPSSNPSKRRKPSNAPSGLRQASFPPEEPSYNLTRSPSVDSSIAGSSVVHGVGGKRKKAKTKSAAGSVKNGSVVNGKIPTATGSLIDGRAGSAGVEGEAEDEEGEVNAIMVDEDGQLDEAAKNDKLQILVDALNPDQLERYETYRRVKLRKETVRKITNQTLSQSVPASVITTINGYTKIFIGEIVERAREVQTQQLAACSATGTVREGDRGPLLPDHLREALRRYKRDGDATAGFQGMSLGRREETAIRSKGKRLFR